MIAYQGIGDLMMSEKYRELTNTEIWCNHVTEIITGHQWYTIPKPRGMPILERVGKSLTVSMEHPIITAKTRQLNHSFMFGEASWILSGQNDLGTIQKHMKKIGNYSDNGRMLSGAYGPPVVRQLEYVKRSLQNDMYSRQAVLTIWQERPEPSKDIPCTVSMQFLIRDNQIHCVTNMRSSDAYIGLPYDIFVFSCISAKVRDMLDIEGLSLGKLTITAGSSHVYKENFEDAVILLPQTRQNDNNDKAPFNFNITAKHGIVAELERVLGELANGK